MRQRSRWWYMLFFQYQGVAEEALARDGWRLFREFIAPQQQLPPPPPQQPHAAGGAPPPPLLPQGPAVDLDVVTQQQQAVSEYVDALSQPGGKGPGRQRGKGWGGGGCRWRAAGGKGVGSGAIHATNLLDHVSSCDDPAVSAVCCQRRVQRCGTNTCACLAALPGRGPNGAILPLPPIDLSKSRRCLSPPSLMHTPLPPRTPLRRAGALSAALGWYRSNFNAALFADTQPRPFPPLRMPVMGVWGEADPALTEEQMTVSEQYVLPGLWRYERLPRPVGHWIPRDAPEVLNRLLLSFFSQPFAVEKASSQPTKGAQQHRSRL